MSTDPVIPRHYVIRYRVMRCEHCNHETRESEFLALFLLRPRNNQGQPVKEYKLVKAPTFNLPIHHVIAPTRTTPFCIECGTIDLSHLPNPPSGDQLYDLAEPVVKSIMPRRPGQSPVATKPRIEDLA